MRPEAKKHLEDARRAGALIAEFTSGKAFDDYSASALLRSAVERQFAIIGEALSRLGRDDAASLGLVREARRIIAFRNILVHGYDAIDDRVVWDVVASHLPDLRRDVEALLGS